MKSIQNNETHLLVDSYQHQNGNRNDKNTNLEESQSNLKSSNQIEDEVQGSEKKAEARFGLNFFKRLFLLWRISFQNKRNIWFLVGSVLFAFLAIALLCFAPQIVANMTCLVMISNFLWIIQLQFIINYNYQCNL